MLRRMNRLSRSGKQPCRGANRKRATRFRPTLEALEELTLLATVTWVAGSGDWQNPANWSDEDGISRLPGPDDDAVIDVPGISVSHSAAIDSVKSLQTSNGTFDLSGGTLRVATSLQGNSTFRISGSATLANANVQSGTTVTSTSSGGRLDRVTLNGDLDMTTSSSISLTITNGLTLNGTASLGNASGTTSGFLSFSGDQVLGGAGAVVFGGSDSNTLSVAGGTTLTIGANVTVQGGHGSLSGTFLNQGMIVADAGGALSLNGTGWSNAGTLAAPNGGRLNLAGSSSSAGTFTVGAGSILNFSSGTHTLTADSSLSGDGNVLFSGGTTFVDGTFAAPGGISIQQGATLSGRGTLTGDVLNAGQINPGRIGSAGILTIIGNYTQTATGILTIEIGGLNPGDQFDQLSVSGLATLNGTLAVGLVSGFRPQADDSFEILTFGSASGDFSVRTGLDLGGGLSLVPSLGSDSLTLVATEN
jgi:hypothetical protein